MQILPVLDLMARQIVRGIAGRRNEYRPIVSTLVDSAEPLAVARAMRERFGFEEFYLADLDAIQTGTAAESVYRQLVAERFGLWIDAGLRNGGDPLLEVLSTINPTGIVIGLESVEGPEALRRIVAAIGVEQAIFSLDLKAGRPLGRVDLWGTDVAWDIAQRAIEVIGIRRMIVLDLARVGVGGGVGTEELCTRLKNAYTDLELTAGGGVRGIDDVNRLADAGVDRVLVASALHDGNITPMAFRGR
jgi:phosphoribosylformimino-5-aminoimidazole carboxamide ribotide isomerase